MIITAQIAQGLACQDQATCHIFHCNLKPASTTDTSAQAGWLHRLRKLRITLCVDATQAVVFCCVGVA